MRALRGGSPVYPRRRSSHRPPTRSAGASRRSPLVSAILAERVRLGRVAGDEGSGELLAARLDALLAHHAARLADAADLPARERVAPHGLKLAVDAAAVPHVAGRALRAAELGLVPDLRVRLAVEGGVRGAEPLEHREQVEGLLPAVGEHAAPVHVVVDRAARLLRELLHLADEAGRPLPWPDPVPPVGERVVIHRLEAVARHAEQVRPGEPVLVLAADEAAYAAHLEVVEFDVSAAREGPPVDMSRACRGHVSWTCLRRTREGPPEAAHQRLEVLLLEREVVEPERAAAGDGDRAAAQVHAEGVVGRVRVLNFELDVAHLDADRIREEALAQRPLGLGGGLGSEAVLLPPRVPLLEVLVRAVARAHRPSERAEHAVAERVRLVADALRELVVGVERVEPQRASLAALVQTADQLDRPHL
mmetsp:Transcript_6534/g.19663  ORF Transcript_6534/g.19663 Transcript_6534/m.19663 type:complete len:420 (-) Transcript_6534:344-1603(-)